MRHSLKTVVLAGLATLFCATYAQNAYIGASLGALAEEGVNIGVQAGLKPTPALELRVSLEPSVSCLLGRCQSVIAGLMSGVELFYKPSGAEKTWQGYVGGGVTLALLQSGFRNTALYLTPLPTITGGYEYRNGRLGYFGELRLLVLIPYPFPAASLRGGVNVPF